MKVRELLQIPFFRRCRFISTHSVPPFSEDDMLSLEDEIEDIKEFVYYNDFFKIESEKSNTGYFLVPNDITYVVCKVKQKE